MDAPKRSLPLLLLLKRLWTRARNMDVTQLDVFRHCRCLRHAGKVRRGWLRKAGGLHDAFVGGVTTEPAAPQVMVLFVLALVACIYYSTVTR